MTRILLKYKKNVIKDITHGEKVADYRQEIGQ